MKASFFSEYCLYAVVRGLGMGLRALPISWALACGRGAGTAASWLQPKRRALGLGNLKAAFGAERSPEELARINRRVFQNLGMSFVEVLWTPKIDVAYVDRWITVQGREHLDRAVAQGRGVILVTAHFGNWELTNLMAGLKGYPMSVLARQQGLPRLYHLLNTYRESKGCRVIAKGMAVRAMVRQLQAGGIVGILADQDAGRRGVLVPFFGRLASTASGPIALGIHMSCPVLPAFIIRTKGPAHTVYLEPPLPLGTSDSAAALHEGVAAYMQVVERFVRRAPDQWLWPHRRWKSSPHRAVVALSDGRAGHRTQVTAAAGLIAQAWQERQAQDARLHGLAGPWMRHTLIEVHYRSAWRRGLLTLAECLRMTAVEPRRWLRWALTAESDRALERTWASLVVSCGAATGLVNLLWSRSIAAKAVHVMQPPWPFHHRFDLRIVPQHDRPATDPKTIVTRAALHQIQPDHPAARAAGQRPPWSLGRPRQIGCLIGGDSRGLRLPAEVMAVVVDQLLMAAQQVDAEVLMTTSRRTPPSVETLLEQRLRRHERCPVLVVARRDPSDGVVPGILASSHLLVVSGDSMSMISEAAASGKPVLVFEPRLLWPSPKRRRFLHALVADGAIRVVAPPMLGQQIVALMGAATAGPVVTDRAMILNRLRAWL